MLAAIGPVIIGANIAIDEAFWKPSLFMNLGALSFFQNPLGFGGFPAGPPLAARCVASCWCACAACCCCCRCCCCCNVKAGCAKLGIIPLAACCIKRELAIAARSPSGWSRLTAAKLGWTAPSATWGKGWVLNSGRLPPIFLSVLKALFRGLAKLGRKPWDAPPISRFLSAGRSPYTFVYVPSIFCFSWFFSILNLSPPSAKDLLPFIPLKLFQAASKGLPFNTLLCAAATAPSLSFLFLNCRTPPGSTELLGEEIFSHKSLMYLSPIPPTVPDLSSILRTEGGRSNKFLSPCEALARGFISKAAFSLAAPVCLTSPCIPCIISSNIYPFAPVSKNLLVTLFAFGELSLKFNSGTFPPEAFLKNCFVISTR